MKFLHSRVGAVLAGTCVLALASGGVAVAANTIGSADIRNNSIRSMDVKDGTLGLRDMNQFAKNRINRPGPAGEDGATGPAGPRGESHDINATWTANPNSRTEGYTAVLKGTNTSVETKNLGVTVQAGDVISFEYSLLDGATCTAGGPRMFVKVGSVYENTFDDGANCGTNGEVVHVLENGGTITEAGLVHDNGSGGTVYVTDVLVDGLPVFLG